MKKTIVKNQHYHASRLIAKKLRALDKKIDGRVDYEKKKREALEKSVNTVSRQQEAILRRVDFLADLLDDEHFAMTLTKITAVVAFGLALYGVLR